MRIEYYKEGYSNLRRWEGTVICEENYWVMNGYKSAEHDR